MEFKSYLTYDEYCELSGKVSEEEFPPLLRKAQRYLDVYTFNRIKELPEIPDVVKELLADFVDRTSDYSNQSSNGETIKRYSNGVETIEYRRTTETEFSRSLNKLAVQWLPDYLICKGVNFDVRKYLQTEDNNS